MMAHFTVAIFLAVKGRSSTVTWSLLAKTSFVLFELAFSLTYVITLMFWITVYKPGYLPFDMVLTATFHAGNVTLMTWEGLWCRNQFMAKHCFIFIPLVAVVYSIVNYIYMKANNDVLYSFLTWNSGKNHLRFLFFLINIFFF